MHISVLISVVMLSAHIRCVVMLSVIMLSVNSVVPCCYDECCYIEGYYTECRCTVRLFAECSYVVSW